ITEIAKICPSSRPCRREKAIRSRFAALSMIATEGRRISGERRSITPSAPVAKRSALRTTYHWMSGPCIALQLPCVGTEHDAADGGDEQDDRGDLEREQVVRQEELADRRRRAEAPADVARLGEEAARLQADDDDHLAEDGAARRHRAEHLPGRAAGPRRLLAAVAEVGDHEEEHHHHGAAVDEYLPCRDELAREQQEQHGQRG